jgi:hypothetical protein
MLGGYPRRHRLSDQTPSVSVSRLQVVGGPEVHPSRDQRRHPRHYQDRQSRRRLELWSHARLTKRSCGGSHHRLHQCDVRSQHGQHRICPTWRPSWVRRRAPDRRRTDLPMHSLLLGSWLEWKAKTAGIRKLANSTEGFGHPFRTLECTTRRTLRGSWSRGPIWTS